MVSYYYRTIRHKPFGPAPLPERVAAALAAAEQGWGTEAREPRAAKEAKGLPCHSNASEQPEDEEHAEVAEEA